jgi:hypothetical protein
VQQLATSSNGEPQVKPIWRAFRVAGRCGGLQLAALQGITDDFAPADVYDVIGRDLRRRK